MAILDLKIHKKHFFTATRVKKICLNFNDREKKKFCIISTAHIPSRMRLKTVDSKLSFMCDSTCIIQNAI